MTGVHRQAGASDVAADAALIADIGGLLARRRGWVRALLSIGTGLVFGFIGAAGLFAVVWSATRPPAPAAAPVSPWSAGNIIGGLLLLTFTALNLFAVIYYARQLGRTLDFHELAVVERQFGRLRRVIRYVECDRFRFRIQRKKKYGIHVASLALLDLAAPPVTSDGIANAAGRGRRRRIRWLGGYKERARGFTLVRRNFESTDELDHVCMAIGDAMADAWMDRLLVPGTAGQGVNWAGQAVFMADGIWSARKRRGPDGRPVVDPLVRYESIERIGMLNGAIKGYATGESLPFVSVSMLAVNYWPGARLLERLARSARVEEQPSEGEGEGGQDSDD